MRWCVEQYGEECFSDITQYKKAIEEHLQKDESLDSKQKKLLLSTDLWKTQALLLKTAYLLKKELPYTEYDDYNLFKEEAETLLKKHGIKLTSTEKSSLYNAISYYDENAAKVIKKISKIEGKKLEDLLSHLSCEEKDLPDFGYYPSSKKGEYIEYESESDLRDSESIPLKENIHNYFLKEVKPHIEESWINLENVKIGYEISFNKYFYTHKPLRSLKEVAHEIIELEHQNDGLLKEILGEKE